LCNKDIRTELTEFIIEVELNIYIIYIRLSCRVFTIYILILKADSELEKNILNIILKISQKYDSNNDNDIEKVLII